MKLFEYQKFPVCAARYQSRRLSSMRASTMRQSLAEFGTPYFSWMMKELLSLGF